MAVEPRRCAQRAAIVLAIWHVLLFNATPTAGQCLSPVAEQTLKELLAAGTLQTTLGRDFTLAGVNLTGTKIEVQVESTNGHRYSVDLSLPEASERPPDRRGERFVFHLIATEAPHSPDAVKALLATADLIDRTLPDTAFADCSGQPSPPPGQAVRYTHVYPRKLALSSALVQVLILMAATAFGWRAVRSM